MLRLPQDVWRRTQLLYVCSPGNPTGKVLSLAEWKEIFGLADRHGFIVASDECYSEIYFDEATPPWEPFRRPRNWAVGSSGW